MTFIEPDRISGRTERELFIAAHKADDPLLAVELDKDGDYYGQHPSGEFYNPFLEYIFMGWCLAKGLDASRPD